MFVPQKVTTPENIGTIELFGSGLSTSVQSVVIAFKELNIPFMHRQSMPGSPELYEFSPFGTIPVVVHRPNAIYSDRDSVSLFEPLAIVRYIDEILASRSDDPDQPTLFPAPAAQHERNYADNALLRVEIDQLLSLVFERIQPAVEDRYVKPYFALRNNGASKEDIAVALSESHTQVSELLMLFERVIVNTQARLHIQSREFIFGSNSWVDVLLFPILRDLKATKSGLLEGGEKDNLPWLSAWLNSFSRRPSAIATLHTSFAGSV